MRQAIGKVRTAVAAIAGITVLLTACGPGASASESISPAASRSTTEGPSPSPAYQRASVIARVTVPHPDPQAPFLTELAVTDNAIWLLDAAGRYLVRIDLKSNEVTAVAPADLATLVSGDGRLWSVGPQVGAGGPAPPSFTLTRLNPDSGIVEFTAQIPVGLVAAGLGAVWDLQVSPMFTVNGDVSSSLVKVDPDNGRVLATWPVQGQSVFVACGMLWTFGWSESGAFMQRIDPATGRGSSVATFPENPEGAPAMAGSGGSCSLVTSDGTQQMVAGQFSDPLPGPPGSALIVVGDALWVTTPGGLIGPYDPTAGNAAAEWLLPAVDLAVNAKGLPDWLLTSAGGNLWLLNGREAVRYNVPA
jgi:hypothetical protein